MDKNHIIPTNSGYDFYKKEYSSVYMDIEKKLMLI